MAVETHGPLLAGVSWVLVIVSCIFLSLRIYCKFVRSRGLWYDDGVLICAWVSARSVFVVLKAGLTKEDMSLRRHLLDVRDDFQGFRQTLQRH